MHVYICVEGNRSEYAFVEDEDDQELARHYIRAMIAI